MLSHLDVVKNIKESIMSLKFDSVERWLNTLTVAMDQLLLDVQVRQWCLLAEIDVFSLFKHRLKEDQNKLS